MNGILPKPYYDWISKVYNLLGPITMILIIIAIALIGGFAISRICKLCKIPYVTGYIILGILLGPSLLAIIPRYMVTGFDGYTSTNQYIGYAGLSFVGDITMGFIAFSCGRYFKFSSLKDAGIKVFLISLFTSLIIGVVVGGVSYLIYGLAFNKASEYGVAPAFIIGACAATISPTATSSIIRQYKAKGPFVETIFQNILFCNIVAILLFSLVLGLTSTGVLGGVDTVGDVNAGQVIYTTIKPLISNLLFCFVGAVFGFILSKLNNYKRTNDSRIILTIAFSTILVALSSIPYSSISSALPLAKVSPLLPCMAFGIFYYNFSKSEALFFQLDAFLPPVLCLFFVVSGAKLDFSSFQDLAVVIIAILFVLFRTGSQFFSLHFVGRAFGYNKSTRLYLTLTMLTLTSVAVGLINLAQMVLPENNEMINFVYTIVLTGCVILEIIGPTFAKIALVKTGSVDPATLIPPRDPRLAKHVNTSTSDSD